MMDFEAAAAALSKANDSTVSRVSRTVSMLNDLLRVKETQEAELKVTNEAIRKIETEDLPTILSEAGLSRIETEDGIEVKVQPFYAASIPKERQEEAYEWLRANGHGDIVKNEISVMFGRQEDTKALALLNELSARYNASQRQKVEPMTLKAFVKEQMEGGVEGFPEDLFGVYHGNKATLKQKVRK